MSIIKLQLDYDYDFLLIGILSSSPDYKLCWAINKLLSINLVKEEDLELLVDEKHNDTLELQFESNFSNPKFSMFYYYDDVNHIGYRVIANKSDKGMLIKEEQSVDYFLIVEGIYDDFVKEDNIIKSLKKSEEIITLYKINPNDLKSKQNLIFE